ncbi:hypothetical protein E1B28_000288 [Marasmius oreades]|uniref:Mitochondrial carrier n=1 Tax=Marasmius oreades TaxID=181124 RepID=A0A9P7V143_9AGAR|nr:uncharacterized protein E1B28_000288 [Marasmius oreades]KAG7098327.1 hypothetical protein E1B28_000288 [Marasmius oreades]
MTIDPSPSTLPTPTSFLSMSPSKWLIFPASFLFTLVVMLPLSGLLVRWRAHFSPTRTRREGSGEEQVQQEAMKSPVMGYFTIARKVYALEGLKGLYKGIGMQLISIVISSALSHLIIPFPFFTSGGDEYKPPTRKPRGSIHFGNPDIRVSTHLADWVLRLAIDIPTQILLNRAITTPYKLSFTSPLKSLSLLLSPSELQNPSNLYLIPGITLSRFLLVFSWAAVDPIISLLIPVYDPNSPSAGGSGVRAQVPFLAFTVLGSIIKTPLSVASVRLSLQRFEHGGTPPGNEAEPSDTTVQLERYSTEDVITLKDTRRYPYTGLLDCLNTIIREEGWKTLFRSGWLTFLGI